MVSSNKSVLLIDDDPSIGKLLEKILTNVGIEFNHCLDLKDSVSFLSSFTPHLILLDLNLSEVDGLKIFESAEVSALLKSIPVVVLTASSKSRDISRAMSIGVKDYIIKPINSQTILLKVKKVLEEQETKSLEFKEPQKASLRVHCEFRRVGETQLSMISPIKLVQGAKLNVKGALIEKYLDENVRYKAAYNSVFHGEDGFLTYMDFIGMNNQNINKLKKLFTVKK